MRIVILGYIIRAPIGGLTWHYLQYAMGLAKLGHDVYYLEDSDDYESCYNPTKHYKSADPTFGLNYAAKVFSKVDLKNAWAYYDAHTSNWFGPCARDIDKICKTADILINISEVNPIRSWLYDIPIRILIDTDPGFNQIRHLQNAKMRATAKLHTDFFSFGENIHKGTCYIPDDGFNWKPTRQPIVLDAWKHTTGPIDGKYTTVMQWDSYPAVQYEEFRYGLKSEMFNEFLDLPMNTDQKLELALGSRNAPREKLKKFGWQINDPLKITEDPWTYQKYINSSKAEFSIAKHGYVISNSGWFSERSAAYLASGRPVLAQETGFSSFIETGNGLLSFADKEEALEKIELINQDYLSHCRSARQMAEEYFNSERVLTLLLNEVT